MVSWKLCRATPSWCKLLPHLMRAAASRTFWTAGTSSPIKMAMMAITTRSSIRVKPRWRSHLLRSLLKTGIVSPLGKRMMESEHPLQSKGTRGRKRSGRGGKTGAGSPARHQALQLRLLQFGKRTHRTDRHVLPVDPDLLVEDDPLDAELGAGLVGLRLCHLVGLVVAWRFERVIEVLDLELAQLVLGQAARPVLEFLDRGRGLVGVGATEVAVQGRELHDVDR